MLDYLKCRVGRSSLLYYFSSYVNELFLSVRGTSSKVSCFIMLSQVAHLREFLLFINNLDLSEIVAQSNAAAVVLICWSVSDYRHECLLLSLEYTNICLIAFLIMPLRSEHTVGVGPYTSLIL